MLTEQQAVELAEALELPHVKQGMFLIRLAEVDLHDRLHQRLIQSLQACGPGASDGELITAMRFVFGHEMQAAGDGAATSKVGADRMLAVDTAEVREVARGEGVNMSLTDARRIVEARPEYWVLRENHARFVQRERYCREMMKALQAALDNFRTGQADRRAADTWHAQNGV